MKELLDWCERQGDTTCIPEIVTILEQRPEVTGVRVLLLLWTEATGEAPEPSMGGFGNPEPTQFPENIEKFYRRFPSLPVFRPLMSCPACDMPALNLNQFIGDLAINHGKTAGEIARHIKAIWKSLYPAEPTEPAAEATESGGRPNDNRDSD